MDKYKYNNTILVNQNNMEPINCSAIILGDMRQKFNPATNTYTENQDGMYLWKIDQHRGGSHFLLAYENSRSIKNK